MNSEAVTQIEDSFLSFLGRIQRAIEIKTDDDYQFALELLEQLMTKAEDREGEPLLYLMDIVSDSIEDYENSLESIQRFDQEGNSIDPGISTLRVLIDQYGLTYSDLKDEIGTKSLVSQILSGSKSLTKTHIAKLSKRFNISPQLFF
ncbi:helix-turn-helix domain-containing protein [Pelobacter seleniigenes]|uniref:helix-turn-helix domain-containing protein n=1 Tax=Pelobacter seleniigenes TaxID=407188 RepID=UPI0004A726AC|nr:helix-turn-helix domain-containing protein [Pelobacter seleniigenes]